MGSAFASGGKSKSSNSMEQNIWDPQGEALGNVYDQAGNLYNEMAPYSRHGMSMAPGIRDQMGDVYNQSVQGAQGQMGGGAYGDTSRYNDMLYDSMNNQGPSNMSRMYQDIVGGPGNTYADPLVDSMRSGMNDNRRAIGNKIDLGAQEYGQGGSSKHAMQGAMNDRNFNNDMNLAEMAIREGNYANDMDWKMDIARQADSNTQLDRDRMMNMVTGANQSQQYGIGAGQGLQNLGMGQMAPWLQAMQGPWQNMQNYSSAIGDPTVLTSGQGEGSSWNFGTGGSFMG